MSSPGSGRLAGRTAFVTGASRGIGAAIASRFAAEGASVALFATSGDDRPGRLPGTVHGVARAIVEDGGRALALVGDVRRDEDVEAAVARAVEHFGGLDIVVNNAAAFDTTPTSRISMKRYDLLHGVNARGSFLLSRTALPHLERSTTGHILSIAPPLTVEGRWLGAHLAYTTSKYSVSLMTLGLAAELADRGIAANALWPRTAIATEGIRVILGEEAAARQARRPELMADAALAVVRRDPRSCTGNLFLDDEVLRAEGITDLGPYLAGSGADELQPSFFLPEETR